MREHHDRARGCTANSGCARVLFFVLLRLLLTASRAGGTGAASAHFPFSSRGLRRSHRRQVVGGLLFFVCYLQETAGWEWGRSPARSCPPTRRGEQSTGKSAHKSAHDDTITCGRVRICSCARGFPRTPSTPGCPQARPISPPPARPRAETGLPPFPRPW